MEIPDTFYYHRVGAETQGTMDIVRGAYHDLLRLLMPILPEGRPKSLCLTELEYSMMRAIQALAIAEGEKIVPYGDEDD